MLSVKVSTQNPILFISDSSGGIPPDPPDGLKIQHTSSCIACPCLHYVDGESQVKLGAYAEVGSNETPDFDGVLSTPRQDIVVSSVEGIVLKLPVVGRQMRIRIWLSHPRWPDVIAIAIG